MMWSVCRALLALTEVTVMEEELCESSLVSPTAD
uniref:Uncharacterized protein n=1 Tax=Anguilla anguilla TaxID=7936 RepID=A0A0E9QPE2_ANGAN